MAASTKGPVALPTVLVSAAGTTGAASAALSSKFEPRDFDLTYTMAQYLDRHLVLPLIEFLQEKKLFPESDLWSAKLELVSKTKMVDYYIEEYQKFHRSDPNPATLTYTTSVVNQQLKDWKEACAPLLDLLEQPELVDQLRRDGHFTVEHLKQSHKVTEEMVDALHRYAKLSFDCGRYRDAADFLYYFRVLSKDEEKKFWALWGKLAAEILMNNPDEALDDLSTLRDAIDARKGDHVVQLQQRTWLIHWSLFVFFAAEDGLSAMIEFLFQDARLLNAIQTTCPHVLRYLTVAVICKRRKNLLKELVRVIVQETGYADPLTDFLRHLYVEFDFETAQKKLKDSEALLANDYFLVTVTESFLESARQLVFETYARTHQCIDIDLLAQRLDIKIGDVKDSKTAAPVPAASSSSAASSVEQKIVELIRNARVDVKIDAKKNQIVMDSSRHPSIYQQVIDKTESLTQRTQDLASEVDKRIQQQIAAKDRD